MKLALFKRDSSVAQKGPFDRLVGIHFARESQGNVNVILLVGNQYIMRNDP